MYGFNVKISGTMEQAVAKVTEALAEEGFGVLTDIDIQATFKKKLDIDRLPYRILGACNPALANQAIQAEPDIGLLLPCNVMIRQNEEGDIIVGFLDPVSMFSLVDQKGIEPLAAEVRAKLERVRDKIA